MGVRGEHHPAHRKPLCSGNLRYIVVDRQNTCELCPDKAQDFGLDLRASRSQRSVPLNTEVSGAGIVTPACARATTASMQGALHKSCNNDPLGQMNSRKAALGPDEVPEGGRLPLFKDSRLGSQGSGRPQSPCPGPTGVLQGTSWEKRRRTRKNRSQETRLEESPGEEAQEDTNLAAREGRQIQGVRKRENSLDSWIPRTGSVWQVRPSRHAGTGTPQGQHDGVRSRRRGSQQS